MKSNKQRRDEIKRLRLKRAERAMAQLTDRKSARPIEGAIPVKVEQIRRHWPTFVPSDGLAFYIDKAFTCRECGSEEVWTAKQQQWWFETVGAKLGSTLSRCFRCRRARQLQIQRAQSGPGANFLREESDWLRSVGKHQQDAATQSRVETALASNQHGLRKLAIDVLGRWQRPEDVPRLKHWWQCGVLSTSPNSGPRNAAALALTEFLKHPEDDAWVLGAYASGDITPWRWNAFLRTMPEDSLNAVLRREVAAGSMSRIRNLDWALSVAGRLPEGEIWNLVQSEAKKAAKRFD